MCFVALLGQKTFFLLLCIGVGLVPAAGVTNNFTIGDPELCLRNYRWVRFEGTAYFREDALPPFSSIEFELPDVMETTR